LDPTFAGNQVIAYLGGVEISRQDFAFSGQPGVNIPDTKAVPGPLDRLELVPAPADYVAYTALVTTSNRCEVAVTAYAQDDSRWANKKYDHLTTGDTTIGRWGCALTSLAMAMSFAGSAVLPDSLNAFMIAQAGFTGSGAVRWDVTTSRLSERVLRWNHLGGTDDRAALSARLCAGTPVIVYVPSLVTQGGSHFVLVTGGPRNPSDSTALSEFSIIDPNPGSGAVSLEPYGSFALRGFPAPVGGGASLALASPSGSLSAALGAQANSRTLSITGEGGSLFITDPSGRRLGQESPDAVVINEIPDALYYPHDEPDAHEGVARLPQAAVGIVPNPIAGTYRVTLNGSSTTHGSVLVSVELADLTWVDDTKSVEVVQGQSYVFDVAFDPTSTTAPIVTPVLPAWAPNVQYSAGDGASFEGLDYECRQAHTSQVGWEPPVVYALWARINAGATWAPQVLYQTGDEVVYQAVGYRALQGHQSQPGWEPPNVPALWTVVN
jgi:hypothetical protein